MNETQLIREQLGTERGHARAVASACAAALGAAAPQTLTSGSPLEEFRQACVDYLVCVLAWFEERDRRLAQLCGALADEPLARTGSSREALERLEAAFAGAPAARGAAPVPGWHEFLEFFNGPWSARRDALELTVVADARAVAWRTISGIDADGILEERARYARVAATLPAGMSLNPPPLKTR